MKFAGRPALVYILIEHKRWIDRWVALQLLKYVLRIWERELARDPKAQGLPPVVPLVVYHGESAWSAPQGLWDLLDPAVREEPALGRLTPSFGFLVDDSTEATDEALFSRAMGLFAGIAAVFLRDSRTPSRFGALDEVTVRRLEDSDEAALERLAERVLTARTLEEVLSTFFS